ncbi:ribose 5-phosphate isomerase B [Chloroflexota bacterium]
MRVALGCDHRGLSFKQAIISLLGDMGHSYEDFGCYNTTSADYPDFAKKVAVAVAEGKFDLGILICSTGIGMCITANKVKGIRAALCHNLFTASRARQHNDANLLCLGEDVLGQGLVMEIVRTFIDTKFEGGRHSRRLDKIKALEN